MILVSGDSTPAFSLTDTGPDPALPGNDQFFSNVLGAGQDVLVLNTTFSSSSFEINEFYASLAGKTSTLLTGTITAADLSGKELLVLSTPDDAFTPAEVSAIQNFSNSGGAIFAIGEGTAPGLTEANADINSLLTQLGSPLRLGTVDMDDGLQFATGSHIAADPLTAGVTSFRYGATVEVSGGTKLFVRAVIEPGAGQVLELVSGLRGTATVSYDVNARPGDRRHRPRGGGAVERMVAVADLVKASDEDLANLYPGLDLVEAAASCSRSDRPRSW